MAKAAQRFGVIVGTALLLCAVGGCTLKALVELRPSDCINPPTEGCVGAINESRILEVRLYQLKDLVDPCKQDLEAFAQGKDVEALASAIVETARKEPLVWTFKVSANEPRNVTWEIDKDTKYVLAVAIGRGRSRNSARLIPIERLKSGWQFPTLHFRGYDICLDQRCNDHAVEAQCR